MIAWVRRLYRKATRRMVGVVIHVPAKAGAAESRLALQRLFTLIPADRPVHLRGGVGMYTPSEAQDDDPALFIPVIRYHASWQATR